MIKSLSARGKDTEVHYMRTEIEPEKTAENIEQLYNKYNKMVYRVSLSYLKNIEDTKDAVSDIFLKVIQAQINFKNSEHEKAWLLRATINLCKDLLKSKRRKNVNIDEYIDTAGENPFDSDDTLSAVIALPDKYKYAVYMHYYEGYKTEEIAKILKKPHSTVRYHLQEARKILKGVLEHE